MPSLLEGQRSSDLRTEHFFASGFLVCGLAGLGWAWVCLQAGGALLQMGWAGLGAALPLHFILLLRRAGPSFSGQ